MSVAADALVARIAAIVKRPGKPCVIFNERARSFVLAEMYGSTLQEWFLLDNWPHVSMREWEAIVRCLRPTARTLREGREQITRQVMRDRESHQNLGRKWREDIQRSKTTYHNEGKKIAASHPYYNHPKVKGD